MKRLIACLLSAALCIFLPSSALAGDNGYKVKYDGGSISGVKTGAGLRDS